MDNKGQGHRATTTGPSTVCKICRCSVFETDQVVWTRRGATPGIAHASCVDQILDEERRAAGDGAIA